MIGLPLLKSIICRFVIITEYCHRCGHQVDSVWYAPDELWSYGNTILCMKCFEKLHKKQGLFIRWIPQKL